MGRKNNKKWGKNKKPQKSPNEDDRAVKSESEKKHYQVKRCFNRKLEAYYAVQNLHNLRYNEETKSFVPCETDEEKEIERQSWVKSMGTILPASFRLGQDIGDELRDGLEKQLEEYVGKEFEITVSSAEGTVVNNKHRVQKDDTNKNNNSSENVKDENKDEQQDSKKVEVPAVTTTTKMVAPAKKIPYIPYGYQMSVDRRTIRRNQSLEAFHQWLVTQSDAGFLTRQETVSMIPPIVLDPKPHHAILDMCAAPGSKTSQLLEIVGVVSKKDHDEPKGFVVANDSDVQRAYMLVSQIRRLNSPSIFVTSCDAQMFPLLRHPSDTSHDIAQEGIFDRVLADVPCSGDGTARKNMGIWKFWNQGGSLALHPLQLSIALNGARLTKVGGYLCYSTCSMNPMENEAVVAELLRSTDGSLELVDKRPDMPGLLARPGWSTWQVLAESKRSKKDSKNKQKKNNPKMLERRRQWAEKNKDNVDVKTEENGNDTTATTTESVNTEKVEDDKNKDVDLEKSDIKETDENVEQDEWIRPPPSWDHDSLLERVKSLGLTHYPTVEDVPKDSRRRIRASMFPPSSEEASKFHLERCLRCLPHDMDTGGFFVALLRKVKPLSERARKRMSEVGNDASSQTVQEKRKSKELEVDNSECKRNKVEEEENEKDGKEVKDENKTDIDAINNGTKEESNADEKPNVQNNGENKEKPRSQGRRRHVDLGGERFIPLEPTIFPDIVDFYGLKKTFPMEQYMARASGDAKVLYFITKTVKSKLIDKGMQDRVTVINSGLRAFERGSREVCPSKYRPVQEAVHYIAPHMTKRKLVADAENFCKCFASGAIPISKFSSPFSEEIRTLSLGSYVVVLEGYENDVANKMYAVMWRCRGDNINCLVSKKELQGMRTKINALTGKNFDIENCETNSETPDEIKKEEVVDVEMVISDNDTKEKQDTPQEM